ncbi:hypothetical protein [Sinorhizobium meliloti]|uniref:hypothetical protein n=1 Tax=Rhizobium meliloti TaxID=382 RepID=UPI00031C77C6|nr:hypothetical protein [Sinorhizobium meliloti]MBP2468073.1 hypothetical protein [Sinorhizobium meliloti]MDE4561159.1 hypothetical protein [Sinorhizobium meliloti SM11]QND28144.1 hypothetical protein HB773_22690 [Sinorhizobium meliloti]UIJ93380.1 hypothetical protein LZK74_11840 [Sinorhizobium meliloti]WGI77996.1 hypothetical protein QC756_32595 [Sinorhizobium meliloti]
MEEKGRGNLPFCCRRGAVAGTVCGTPRYSSTATTWMFEMKGIILWLMGVPLIVIILLYMFVF